ncbi:fasciclin domain-containing protein [Pontibacter actiniarum]|nr:fasciclin domain-containing protein [Pontibacter actiniarum]
MILIALFALCWQAGQAHELASPVRQERTSMMEYLLKERPLLADLITKSGLTPLLSGNGPLTLLAPPESALQRIKQEPAERLRAILSAHILKGAYGERDLKDGATLQSISGAGITVCRKDKYTLLNGVRILGPDHQVKNGVVHELGDVISI